MDSESLKVICLFVVDKRETQLKSPNMEKLGLIKALQFCKDRGLTVSELVTDQHIQISAFIRKEHPEIKHSFDIWHASKNLSKKLFKAASVASARPLLQWIPDVVNHFWWTAKQAEGDADRMLSLWRGVIHHVVNVHSWVSGDGSTDAACHHEDLPEPTKEKQWLSPETDAHKALIRLVLDKNLLKNLPYLATFRHTSLLENYHNLILLYAGKRFAFGNMAYEARCLLAAIDHNEHVDRAYVQKSDGSESYHRKFSKHGNAFYVTRRKVPKSYQYMHVIMSSVIERRLGPDPPPIGDMPEQRLDDPRRIKPRIAPLTPEPTQDIATRQKSRMT